nr:importin-5-like [Tanacetum cinerariifolium]
MIDKVDASFLKGLLEHTSAAQQQIYVPLLDENQVRSIVDEIKQVITSSSSRKGERAKRTKANAEEGELLKEEN